MWENMWGYVGPIRDASFHNPELYTEFYLTVDYKGRKLNCRIIENNISLLLYTETYGLILKRMTQKIQDAMVLHDRGELEGLW